VPALAEVRRSIRSRLPERVRLLLELAEWVGIDAACEMSVAELDALVGEMPEPVRARCAVIATSPHVFDVEGRPASVADVIRWLAMAFEEARLDRLMST